ncbi:response regulator [Chryseosolibacter indicus]|uniref:Response regulator transcription factor n=1 Tax=Chryseosolibacter indicus TaxID=2782351 RepID=A0ABS5VZ57_9BACT|nr:response regulator transcription factor [Chryseosolibacter indicus]MBT1705316.1 response regulator transcription factor [Chryseosolibacter indicus]
MKVNVLIVDDEALLREGLRAMLQHESVVKNVYEAHDEKTFQEALIKNTVDLILLDVRLRSVTGFDLLARLKAIDQHPKVIAVTGLDGTEMIINLLKSGVHGIVYKLDGYSEISKAIKNVLQSGTYFPESVLKIIQTNAQRWQEIPSVTLTFQEKEMLKAIATGITTKEIAVHLKMSPSTAETYRIRLMKKVNVPNTAALLAYAFRNGIL